MATLPTPGGDTGTWGTELNEYLLVGHDAGGNNLVSVATTIGALPDSPGNGQVAHLRVGSSPHEFIGLIYDTTYAKWISPVIGGTDGNGASATTTSTSFVEVQDGSSTVQRFFIPNAKDLHDAGLRPQMCILGYLSNSGGGNTTSVRSAIFELGDGDTAQASVGTGTSLDHVGVTATFKFQTWETITLSALTDAHWFAEAQMKVTAGTGTIARVAVRFRWTANAA